MCGPPRVHAMTEPLREVAGLDLELDGRRLLAGIGLGIAPGEVHALVGANGSGKTTLARALMGAEGYTPGSGTVRAGGRAKPGAPADHPGRAHRRDRSGLSAAYRGGHPGPARGRGGDAPDHPRGDLDPQGGQRLPALRRARPLPGHARVGGGALQATPMQPLRRSPCPTPRPTQ